VASSAAVMICCGGAWVRGAANQGAVFTFYVRMVVLMGMVVEWVGKFLDG
jgi:hypothetical protein